jgi:hypothetical protein
MSYHCSLALVEEFLPQSFLTGKSYAELRSIRTAERSYFDAKKKGSSKPSPSGTTSEHLTAYPGVRRWISLLPDSLASPSQSPDNEKAKPTKEICGLKLPVSFAKYDPDTASWKTSQVCLFTNTSEPYSKTWPRAGMIVAGTAYLRQPLAPRTVGIGSGSWPTPRTITGGAESAERKQELGRTKSGGGDLQAAVKSWPTPRVTTSGMVASKAQLARIKRGEEAERGKGACKLEISVALHGGATTPQKGQLNPDWVEWLMGWPIGWTSLEALPISRFREWLVGFGIELTD